MTTEPELDIVEELRFFAEAADSEALVVTMLSGRTFADAADEIERLRRDQTIRQDTNDRAESSQNGSDNATKTANPNDRSDLVAQLRDRACPAGLPWTDENPEEDHGHTDCWLHHQAADEIERLLSQITK